MHYHLSEHHLACELVLDIVPGRDIFRFSGHSLWTRYFQIFLDIVSGRVIVVYNIKVYRGIHINGLGAGYSLPLTCIYSEHDRVSLRTSLSHAVLFVEESLMSWTQGFLFSKVGKNVGHK